MKILYTLPSIDKPHGGYLIVCEHITRLQKLGHEVSLFVEKGPAICAWDRYNINITTDRNAFKNYDCIVIGSPHSIWMEDYIMPSQRCFLFMQMVEEKFRPRDYKWLKTCRKFYLSRFPIIHGSRWGEDVVRGHGRKGEMFYIENGVNLDHFPISTKTKDGKTILLESPVASNPAKDVDQLALKVALRLKNEGYRITSYGAHELNIEGIEHHVKPSLELMNRLYEDATILIKATKYDARALSPVEAMTKGCVTARAILCGDDDLIECHNCLRTSYYESGLYQNAKELLTYQNFTKGIADNCRAYVQEHCNWGKIISEINQILHNETKI